MHMVAIVAFMHIEQKLSYILCYHIASYYSYIASLIIYLAMYLSFCIKHAFIVILI